SGWVYSHGWNRKQSVIGYKLIDGQLQSIGRIRLMDAFRVFDDNGTMHYMHQNHLAEFNELNKAKDATWIKVCKVEKSEAFTHKDNPHYKIIKRTKAKVLTNQHEVRRCANGGYEYSRYCTEVYFGDQHWWVHRDDVNTIPEVVLNTLKEQS